MDSKRFNIYAGSILGGLLLFLLLGFFSRLIYFGPEHAGEEEQVLAFAVPVEEPEAGAEEEAAPDLATLVAEADPSNGESVFNKCRACHSLEAGDHGVGPSLHNVVGGEIAAAEGFGYSDALTGLEGEWTLEKMAGFLENPQGYAPGTKMSFAGVGDPQDRVDVIAYLNQASDSPVELAPEETAAAETATDAAEGEQAAAEGEGQAAEGEQQAAAGGEDQAAAEGEDQAAAGGAGEFADLLANASAEEGEKVYRKCQACHTLEEGKHRVGPSLHGVIGADIGSAEGYSYSDAMAEFEGNWTLENLMGYLEAPNEFMPGNKMTFPGLDDPQDRVNVFAYIDQSDGERDLPEPGAAQEGGQAEGDQAAAEEGQAAEGESQAAAEGEAQQAEGEAQQAEGEARQAEGEQAAAGGAGEYADLLANASVENGETVYRKCQACHTLDEGKHRVGPSLHGVIGADIGGAEGYSYSDAMAEFEGDWTLENLMGYLENPGDFMPGNKMPFAGLRDPQDRIDVFAYIDQSDGERDLPEPGGAAEEAAAEGDQAAAEEGQATEGEQQAAAEGEGQAAEGEQAAAGGGAGAFADLLAAASAEEGETVYRKCQACHTLDEGKHRVGPSLHGVIGTDIGSAEGYNYSDAMAETDGNWTLEKLDAYLENPRDFVPGTKMSFPGLKDPQDRIDVLTYIDGSDGERDLPAAE